MSVRKSDVQDTRIEQLHAPEATSLRRLHARVRTALAAAHVARGGEALAVGLSVLFCVRAVELATSSLNEGWIAALPAASFAAAAWWLERRPSAVDVVRSIDVRLQRDGALFACWEASRANRAVTGLVALLAERLEAVGARAAFARAAVMTTPLVLALPCATAAVYAYAASRAAVHVGVEAEELRSAVARAADGVAGAASRSASNPTSDGALTAAARDAVGLAERVRALLAAPREAVPALDVDALRDASTDARVSSRAAEPGSELASALDTLASRLADLAASAQSAPESPARAARNSAVAALGDGAVPGVTASGSATAPPSGARVGSETSPVPDTALAAAATTPADRTGEARGLASNVRPSPISGGPWWPARYDAVVERWIEARRIPR